VKAFSSFFLVISTLNVIQLFLSLLHILSLSHTSHGERNSFGKIQSNNLKNFLSAYKNCARASSIADISCLENKIVT
jgi:hypothetical protein